MKLRYQIFFVFLVILSSIMGCSVAPTTSALFAKEVCSCMFVSKQDEKYCIDYGQPVFEAGSYTINIEDKTVIAQKLGSFNEARYISERFGCRLIE